MKVSVVIPVYNVCEYVEACLRSVERQDYDNLEVVIVDDCGTDGSMSLVKKLLDEWGGRIDARIVSHSKNRGLSAARNTGIRYSTGDFLYFLDADDELLPDSISTLVKEQERTNAEIVVGDYKVSDPRGKHYPELNASKACLRGSHQIIRKYMKGHHVYVMAWNKLIKRQFLFAHGLFFEEKIMHEDDLWSFRCACCCKRMAIVGEITYFYRIRSGSIMESADFLERFNSRLLIIKEMLDYSQAYGLSANRHVHSHIERQKLMALDLCRDAGLREKGHELYAFCGKLPQPSRWNLLIWYFFNLKKLIRDAHYFLSSPYNEQYYWHVPDYMRERKNIRFRFYRWFLSVLIFNHSRCFSLERGSF